MFVRWIILILILNSCCCYDMDGSIIKEHSLQDHIYQKGVMNTSQSNDTASNIHQLCTMTHDQYYQRLTVNNYKNYEFQGLTEKQVKTIASYFELSYFKDMNKIASKIDIDLDNGTSTFLTQSYETENIVLINNSTDTDQVILGVLAPLDSDNDTIKMQAFFSVHKNSFKMDELIFYNFAINDDDAICNFCTKENPFSDKKCTVKGEFNRIGKLAYVYISSEYIESPDLKATTSDIVFVRSNISPFISQDLLILFVHACLKYMILIIGSKCFNRYKPKYNSICSKVCFSTVILMFTYAVYEIYMSWLDNKYCHSILIRKEGNLTRTMLCLDAMCLLITNLINRIKYKIQEFKSYRKGIKAEKYYLNEFCCNVITIYSTLYLLGIQDYLFPFKIWMYPNSCLLLLSNIYILPIVANIVFRARCVFIHPICIILISVYFVSYPFTILGNSEIVEGFDSIWVTKFMTCSTIHAIILYMQMHYGSRFFLYKFRERTHDKHTFSLFELTEYRFRYCDVCLNYLDDEEMQYEDADKNYNYRKLERDQFIKLDCDHVFHPNCLFMQVKYHQKCPQCKIELPEDDYLD